MILRLGAKLCPVLKSCVNQTRNIRPSIKIDKETFQLTLDVRQFDKEEVRVKARPEFIIVEGKQERKTKDGFVIRQFVRKFKLPIGCDPQTIKTTLSPNGILTVTAPRKFCEKNLPCERIIPISVGDDEEIDQKLIEPEKPSKEDLCAKYIADDRSKTKTDTNKDDKK
ncbi:alpha-crystallin B chain-like [Amyelois transitella]|uniref:alpha-crystallin B chain-like n=1 Tax=Amyelois transitella TaxID=680683 RepID=UPI00067AE6B7|nr:alpha-crystallin B chain-like [Amyelois transitella]